MKNKVSGRLLLVLNLLLILLYLPLLYLCLSRFDFIPWYASDASFILFYVLWLPLSITTIVILLTSFFSGKRSRCDTILLCFNAVLFPLFFVGDFVKLGAFDYILAALGIISIAVYTVRLFASLRK